MRASTVFNRLLRLPAVNVTEVEWAAGTVRVTVRLRRRGLVCPHCQYRTAVAHDVRPGMSSWRHLDLGVWRVEARARLRRLSCPTHGVVVGAEGTSATNLKFELKWRRERWPRKRCPARRSPSRIRVRAG